MDVLEYARRHNGMVTTAGAEAVGIRRARLSEAVAAGSLDRVARGIYCLPETWEDEYAIASLRFPKGTLSHGTALFLHALSDRTPERTTMTFPRSYNAGSARRSGIIVRTCDDRFVGLGCDTVATPLGNAVRCYDVERTLCDMLRGTSSADVQVVNPAMKAYASSHRRDVAKLLHYARTLGVERKIRTYLEVLL